MNKAIDILVIGGGLTGATLMLALQGLGFSALLVEAKPFSDKINPDFDARSLALSPASQRILAMLGLWDLLEEYVTPIEMIHVSTQNHFGTSRLHSKLNLPLGYVIEMQYLNRAIHQLMPSEQLIAPANLLALDLDNHSATIRTETEVLHLKPRLIIAADGSHSAVRGFCGLQARITHYGQHALVANIALLKPHKQQAYERFTVHGPLALLPLHDQRMSLVWALPPKEAQEMMSLSDKDFLYKVQRAFGYRLGRFVKGGKRFCFPLQQVIMPIQTQWPFVFVGNAAHTLHPIAGQGFNLGLRDVATLAQCIAERGLNAQMLDYYARLRSHDQKAINYLTEGLLKLFTSRLPGLGIARGLGLIAFDNIPALKNLLAHYARGFGGVIPDLVCDIPLTPREIK